MARKSQRGALDIEDFQYLDPKTLPALVLGIHIPRDHFRAESGHTHDYRFKKGREWWKIAHEGHFWIGTKLTPTEDAAMRVNALIHGWGGRLEGVNLNTLVSYRETVKRIVNADCADSYALLSSNHLPLDVVYIQDLTTDSLPPPARLDDLIEWESGLDRARNSANRWSAVILA